MALNSLKIATDGYLKKATKSVLVIAVAGYLSFGGTVAPTKSSPQRAYNGGGGHDIHYINELKEDADKRKAKIQIEDSELIAIVELTLKNFII